MWGRANRGWAALFGLLAGLAFGAVPASAQTLERALIDAYHKNPTLNAERARNRAVDELVPQALSGFRPQVSVGADAGHRWTESVGPKTRVSGSHNPRGYGVTLSQNVFNGFRTLNQTRAAESQVLGARETLRNTEQNVLLDAVEAYVNVLRDGALVELQQQNRQALQEQLRATRDRFQVGELTRTDVAQAEARLAQADSQLSAALAQLNASRAAYRRDIGSEPPARLAPANAVENVLPRTLEAALAAGLDRHPAMLASRFGVDTAQLQVKVAEGALLPVVSVEGTLSRRLDPGLATDRTDEASIFGRITVPIYQGGGEYSRIRESKETLGQRQLEADATRDQVRAAVIQSFGLLASSRLQAEAARAQITAAETALAGVQEEYRVGQRTTLDLLNAQAELVSARTALVVAQRDRVVSSYSLLAAVGRLSAADLGLRVDLYEPDEHYNAVRDSWIGIRTPGGR